jgi:hypothetical protein
MVRDPGSRIPVLVRTGIMDPRRDLQMVRTLDLLPDSGPSILDLVDWTLQQCSVSTPRLSPRIRKNRVHQLLSSSVSQPQLKMRDMKIYQIRMNRIR